MPISGAYTYTLDGTDATITAYDVILGGTTPSIPATLDSNDVVAIGPSAFRFKGLTAVTLPSSLVSIGYYAFFYNPITAISLPEGITTLGESAFETNNLSALTLPSTLISIGRECFAGSGPNAFNNITGTLTIPEGVTTIGINAFVGNKIEILNLPTTLVNIGGSCFAYNELTTINIPTSGMTELGSSMFESQHIYDVIADGDPADIYEPTLLEVSIPANITTIGDYCFYDNEILADVYIYSDTVTFGADILFGNMSTELKGTIHGNNPSDAYDWWTNEWTATYNFAPLPSLTGRFKYWNGSTWEIKPIQYWTGAAWEIKPIKYWDGAAWSV